MSLRLIASLALLTGCGTTIVPQETLAVRDFVVVSELESVDYIRLYRQLYYTYVNDHFLTVSVGSRHYLIEFGTRCRALRSENFTPSMVDNRHDPSYLRTRDTIRGCPVDRIYEATAEQLKEIKALSKTQATGVVVSAED